MSGKIHVVGLGSGSWAGMPIGTWEVVSSVKTVFIRTAQHPVVKELEQRGIHFVTFDELYETRETFEEVYQEIARQLIRAAKEQEEAIVYAVPGHPTVAETAVRFLKEQADSSDLQVEIGVGHSFLDEVLRVTNVDLTEGILVLDATRFDGRRIHPDLHLFFLQVYSRDVASDLKLSLMEIYPDDTYVSIIEAAGIPGQEKCTIIPLWELDHHEQFTPLTSLYIPRAKETTALNRHIDQFLRLVEILRSPGGCPWDQKQTHQSLRPYVIEEAYEVADAIDRDEPWDLAEELGDLLLQVGLHAQIASEEGSFTFADVIQHISDKLIRRHPHVFGEGQANTPEEVAKTWQQIKEEEKAVRFTNELPVQISSLLDTVKPVAPSTQIACRLQKEAAKVGFDWAEPGPIYDKIREELDEVYRANNHDEQTGELGDLLFAVCNLARFLQIDPDQALSITNRKFRDRFRYVEEQLALQGKNPACSTLEEMDKLWNLAKQAGF